MNKNNQNSNWKKSLGLRNMQENLEKIFFLLSNHNVRFQDWSFFHLSLVLTALSQDQNKTPNIKNPNDNQKSCSNFFSVKWSFNKFLIISFSFSGTRGTSGFFQSPAHVLCGSGPRAAHRVRCIASATTTSKEQVSKPIR